MNRKKKWSSAGVMALGLCWLLATAGVGAFTWKSLSWDSFVRNSTVYEKVGADSIRANRVHADSLIVSSSGGVRGISLGSPVSPEDSAKVKTLQFPVKITRTFVSDLTTTEDEAVTSTNNSAKYGSVDLLGIDKDNEVAYFNDLAAGDHFFAELGTKRLMARITGNDDDSGNSDVAELRYNIIWSSGLDNDRQIGTGSGTIWFTRLPFGGHTPRLLQLPQRAAQPSCGTNQAGHMYYDSRTGHKRAYFCNGSNWIGLFRTGDPDLVAGNIKSGVQITNGSQTITGTLSQGQTDSDLTAANVKAGININTGAQNVTGTAPYLRNKQWARTDIDSTISGVSKAYDGGSSSLSGLSGSTPTTERKRLCLHHGGLVGKVVSYTSFQTTSNRWWYTNNYAGDTGISSNSSSKSRYVVDTITCQGYY